MRGWTAHKAPYLGHVLEQAHRFVCSRLLPAWHCCHVHYCKCDVNVDANAKVQADSGPCCTYMCTGRPNPNGNWTTAFAENDWVQTKRALWYVAFLRETNESGCLFPPRKANATATTTNYDVESHPKWLLSQVKSQQKLDSCLYWKRLRLHETNSLVRFFREAKRTEQVTTVLITSSSIYRCQMPDAKC